MTRAGILVSLLILLFGVLALVIPALVLAQAAPAPLATVPAPQSWGLIVAVLINTAGVMAVVTVINRIMPKLRAAVPWTVPLIASLLVGPALVAVQSWLSTWLGVPIDLSAIAGAATGLGTGALAVTAHQVYRNAR